MDPNGNGARTLAYTTTGFFKPVKHGSTGFTIAANTTETEPPLGGGLM